MQVFRDAGNRFHVQGLNRPQQPTTTTTTTTMQACLHKSDGETYSLKLHYFMKSARENHVQADVARITLRLLLKSLHD